MRDFKTVLIALLLATTAVLGYLYYDSQRNGVSIKVPGVEIKAK